MGREVLEMKVKATGRDARRDHGRCGERQPARTQCVSEDVAAAIEFFLSDEAGVPDRQRTRCRWWCAPGVPAGHLRSHLSRVAVRCSREARTWSAASASAAAASGPRGAQHDARPPAWPRPNESRVMVASGGRNTPASATGSDVTSEMSWPSRRSAAAITSSTPLRSWSPPTTSAVGGSRWCKLGTAGPWPPSGVNSGLDVPDGHIRTSLCADVLDWPAHVAGRSGNPSGPASTLIRR